MDDLFFCGIEAMWPIVFLAGNLNGGSLVTKFNGICKKPTTFVGWWGANLPTKLSNALGAAFADELDLEGKELVVGHDHERDSSSPVSQQPFRLAQGSVAQTL